MFFKKNPQVFFLICSVCFFSIGAVTALDIAGAFHTTHIIVWQLIPLVGINMLIGYGFLTREAWLMSAFAINLIAMGLLATFSMGTVLNALLFAFLWLNRSALQTLPHSFIRMLCFAALWLMIVWQLVYALF